MVTAVFPAAGQGKRMKLPVNKAFVDLAGVPMLVRTLQKFSRSSLIDFLVVAVGKDEVGRTNELLQSYKRELKPFAVTQGGSERQYSIAAALRLLPPDTDTVLVHDAARPFVSLATIEGVIRVARECGGAIAAVPEKNTIKIVDECGAVVATPARKTLWEVQTPQGFTKDIIMAAYEKAARDDFLGTDDASLVERLPNACVKVVMSDYRNIKITTPEDLITARAFLREEAEEGEEKI